MGVTGVIADECPRCQRITRCIITEHGGTIRVQNSPPRGASFRIELPLQFDPKATQVPEAAASLRS